jgi:WD40 repeat protein
MKKLKLGMALLCFATAIQAQDVEVFPQLGPGAVAALACSPDGRHIVSSSLGGAEIVVWDAESGRELRRLKAAGGGKGALVLDGTRLFSGHVDGIRSWDIESGRDLGVYPSPEVNALALVPGGRRLVSGSADGLVRVWDIESKKLILALRGHNDAVLSLALSPDGRRIYSGSHGIIRIWDAGTGAERGVLAGQEGEILSLALSPDGKRLYSASTAGTIKVWNTEIPGKQHPKTIFYDGYAARNLPLLLSGDGKTIISVSTGILPDRNAYVHIWDADSLEEKGSFAAHTDNISSLAFTDQEDMLVSGSWDHQIKIWALSDGPDKAILSKTLSGNSLNPHDAAFSPDGKTVDVVTGMGVNLGALSWNLLTLSWNLEEGRLERSLAEAIDSQSERYQPEEEPSFSSPNSKKFVKGSTVYDSESGREICVLDTCVSARSWSPDGGRLFGWTVEEKSAIWNAETGRLLVSIPYDTYNCSWSPDGKYIAVAITRDGPDWLIGPLALCDSSTGKELWRVEYVQSIGDSLDLQLQSRSGDITATIESLWWSFDSKQIYFALFGGTFFHYDAASGRLVRKIASENSSAGAVSPDRTIFAIGSVDGTVTLYTVDTGLPLRTLNVHNDGIGFLEFSAAGLYLMSHSDDGIVCVTDVKSGKPLITTAGGYPSFSPDGRRIMIPGSGKCSLWDITTGKEIASFIGFTDGEWVVITPDGFYNASAKGDEYLNIRVGNRVYGIDQYRRRFYRPDLVKLALSGGDAYNAAVREAGVNIQDAAAFVPPRITLTGTTLNGGRLTISAVVEDDSLPVTGVWVQVNGRLAAGKSVTRNLTREGISVSGKDKKVNFTLGVDLDLGDNVIEVFAANAYAEARSTLNRYSEESVLGLPDLWILAVGINDYQDPLLPDLNYAVNDAREIIEVFKKQEGRRYEKVHSLLIADGEASPPGAASIRANMDYFKRARDRDVVLLFIAGHAVNDSGGSYYFCPADARFDGEGNLVPESAISYREINAILDLPGQKLVLIDTCHSAGAGKAGIADPNSFIRDANEFYPVIFTSSRGNELSAEDPKLRHGLFTYGIIEGMKGAAKSRVNNSIMMKGLDAYVSEVVTELSRGRQNPITVTPGGYNNFVIGEIGEE